MHKINTNSTETAILYAVLENYIAENRETHPFTCRHLQPILDQLSVVVDLKAG